MVQKLSDDYLDGEVTTSHVHAALIMSPSAKVDPYGSTMAVIRGALAYGLNHDKQMSTGEWNILVAVRDKIGELDPDSIPLYTDHGEYGEYFS